MFFKVLIRRLLTFLPTILGIATFAFLLGHATPGDPAYAALGIDLEGYSGVDLEEVERVRRTNEFCEFCEFCRSRRSFLHLNDDRKSTL